MCEAQMKSNPHTVSPNQSEKKKKRAARQKNLESHEPTRVRKLQIAVTRRLERRPLYPEELALNDHADDGDHRHVKHKVLCQLLRSPQLKIPQLNVTINSQTPPTLISPLT